MAALKECRKEQENLRLELERSLRMRDDFMSLVAHELRTPLNTLYLETQMRTLQLARGNLAAFGPEQLQKMIARDERQIQSMIRLIEDMLDVARLRSGTLSIRPSPVELIGLLERVINDLALQVAGSGSGLTLHPHPPVCGEWDEFRVEQVIVNLLTNALRHGGGKPVDVSVHSTGSEVRIDVADRGPGISEAERQRISEAFARGAGNGDARGLGLGLYIARQLVEAHGGQLSVRAGEEGGSTFSLTLPLNASY